MSSSLSLSAMPLFYLTKFQQYLFIVFIFVMSSHYCVFKFHFLFKASLGGHGPIPSVICLLNVIDHMDLQTTLADPDLCRLTATRIKAQCRTSLRLSQSYMCSI